MSTHCSAAGKAPFNTSAVLDSHTSVPEESLNSHRLEGAQKALVKPHGSSGLGQDAVQSVPSPAQVSVMFAGACTPVHVHVVPTGAGRGGQCGALGEGVGVVVGVTLGVLVLVAVCVAVWLGVIVTLGVCEAVLLGVTLAVLEAVTLGVWQAVLLGVKLAVSDAVKLGV